MWEVVHQFQLQCCDGLKLIAATMNFPYQEVASLVRVDNFDSIFKSLIKEKQLGYGHAANGSK